MDVNGSRVLISGGARGIGRATALAFRDAGAQVMLCDIDAQAAAQTASELGLSAHGLDVRDASAFATLVQQLDPIDVLVNNAGIMPICPFLTESPQRDRLQLDINLHGVIAGMRAALPGMVRRGRGYVVNIASVAGRIGTPNIAVYSASKHAVIGLSEAVRQELRGSGVGLAYVMPVLVETELISGAGRPRWPPVVGPAQVAAAVVRAVRREQVDVYVPAITRISTVLPALLPRRVYERIGRIFGVDSMFDSVDPEARAAYLARLGSTR